ncbi:hypothetical protein C8R46DRAFT_366327 [Mycena filopes]|nr:hypothetical protein C8R46DRAFT_366327 [Mycena filopes]
MSRVSDLRARVEELSLAILRQKEVLNGLEDARSKIQGQINEIVDPISRLPFELSSCIFELTLPADLPKSNRALITLLNVSHSWTTIALSTPSLWASMRVTSPHTSHDPFETWLSRARASPLSLSLYGAPDPLARPLVARCAPQVHRLALYLGSGPELSSIDYRFSSLTTSTIAPKGRVLEERTYFSISQALELLRAAPGLVKCEFISLFDGPIRPPEYGSPLVLPCLTHMYLGNLEMYENAGDSTARILQCLTLPALEHLSISLFDITNPSDFLSFVTRSAPPLRFLEVEPHSRPDRRVMVECLRRLPTLTDLDLGVVHLEDITASTDSKFLPNLQHLTLRDRLLDSVDLSDEYGSIIRMLTFRASSQLASFKFFRYIKLPDDKTLAALRCFTDRVNIHIHCVQTPRRHRVGLRWATCVYVSLRGSTWVYGVV